MTRFETIAPAHASETFEAVVNGTPIYVPESCHGLPRKTWNIRGDRRNGLDCGAVAQGMNTNYHPEGLHF